MAPGTGGFSDAGFNDGTIIVRDGATVSPPGDAILFGDNTSLTVEENGVVFSGANGVAAGDGFEIDNDGSITGGTGIMGGSGTDADRATIDNTGSITGTPANAIDVDDYVTITNGTAADGDAAASITGGAHGILAGSNLTLTNHDDIEGTMGSGVFATDDASIDNFGSITGGMGDGLHLGNGFDVENDGSIEGGNGIFGGSGTDADRATITNTGSIDGTISHGISVGNFVTITNGTADDSDPDASVTGASIGILAGADLTLTNHDEIEGENASGVQATDDATIDNFGSITGANGDGLHLGNNAVVTNGSSDASDPAASITGSANGIFAGTGLDLTNYGEIEGTTGVTTTGANADIENWGSITGTGGTALNLGSGSDEVVNRGTITGDVNMGSGSDSLLLAAGSTVDGNIDMAQGSDTLELEFGSSVDGDIDMGVATDTLILNSINVSGTVDMGSGGATDTLRVLGDIGPGVIAFSDNVEVYDDDEAPDTALFTGDFLIVADRTVFAGQDALATRQTYQQSTSIMSASATPGWYGSGSIFGGDAEFNGGDVLIGYNAETFGGFLSFSKADADADISDSDFERHNFLLGVKGFTPMGAGVVSGIAYIGRGDGDIKSAMDVTGQAAVDDTSFGMAARYDLKPASGEGLGFSAEAGASRITFDSFDPSGLADATIEERDLTASYVSLETGYSLSLSGGNTIRPFLGAVALFSNGDDVTMSAQGTNNSNAPGSTSFSTSGDDLTMLRLGAELGGSAGWTAKVEGQFDDNGDTTGIVSFGMAF
ncbi:beta strand repeat-containing protein [Pseudooceanicola marinus]|uniref:beta strand repeat-containing protein n=1 Tax=Pseudooceanicola marinus TaxID=396013 RepID=UPI001CD665F4|nr:hypothetical protein [Pseudooceanicola marinus]MCA1334555.1 hypothetical protein [Pseudooceanicola marinus]